MPEIRVNGINIYYEVSGNGYPIVFIHGGGLESGSWRSQVTFFSGRYLVITFDTRGHGKSEIPEGDYTIGDCVDDLHQLVDSLRIKRLHLAGLSMGGNIAMNFTLRYPEMVDALILASSNSGLMTESAAKKGYDAVTRMVRLKRTDMAIKFRKAHEANLNRTDITSRLSEIKKKVLLIQGDQDTETPLYISEKILGGIENSQRVIIPDSGHLCNQDQPDAFNAVMDDFLQSLDAV